MFASEADKRAYILADNKLAEKAGWDRETLPIERQPLVDLDFQVDLSGFDSPEIDIILDEAAERRRSISRIMKDVLSSPVPVRTKDTTKNMAAIEAMMRLHVVNAGGLRESDPIQYGWAFHLMLNLFRCGLVFQNSTNLKGRVTSSARLVNLLGD